ncbi:MAG: DUF4118 domain-containing protein [Chitinophagaceae bacterium]|nr:DUF4118 domain-containing protein [Chitinophagaceae bacterium]MBL0056118.1 DUF4118 domain-containing protein [Chitinophagaceae bacterium]
MPGLFINTISKPKQYFFSILLITLVSFTSYLLSPLMGYRVVAFILLLTVSMLAMFFDILPVLISAVISALVWNFFFIPPHFTFSIGSTEDFILFLMYFVIALVNAVLTYKIRLVEKQARQREEKANTLKLYNTLLNSLSHELRTPIAAIIGATDNLQNNNAKLSPQNRLDLMAEIDKGASRLNQQVENLLNMSRLESGFIQPKNDWCDISDLIYDIVNRVEENNPRRQIRVGIQPGIPLFKLDAGLLEQAISNLLNNSVQYTDRDGMIMISAACYSDLLELVIEDEGPGFPADQIDLVFDKFYRLTNSKPGGTGLGLSIVKGFIEAMGGQITLKNKSTGGAKFTIRIAAETSYLKNLKNE